jgi:hypothetical protein
MTAVQGARRTAWRTARSGALEALTRVGFLGYGLLHLAVAWLAVQIALGHPGGDGDQSGAFRYLAGQPFGLLLAAIGHRDEQGFSRTAERLASAARTVIYGALAVTAWHVVAGDPTSNAEQQQSATAGIMAHPWGHFLVGLAGVAVVAVGVGLLVYGWRRKFERRLMIARMSHHTRRVAVRLGQFGYVAKGVAFGVVGLLLIDAAVSDNPAKSRGLDAALRLLVEQPYGALLLIVVAVGFGAFGAYCFFQSKYRKVRP